MPGYDPLLLPELDRPLADIITGAPRMPLHDGGADEATVRGLEEWLKSKPTISPDRLAGLWLLAGDLERSHSLSQQLETITGSYWHGIMHRREGDYFNAKYWMRRTSGHPVSDELRRREPTYRDAIAFVDYVERAVTRDQSLRDTAEHLQWLEWQLLFAQA